MKIPLYKRILAILMILNGLFFLAGTYVLGDTQAIIAMHEDLAPDAGPVMANAKAVICLLTGLGYLLAALGVIWKRPGLIPAGVLGSALFLGLYCVELVLWAGTNPTVWLGFLIFGILSLVFGVFCLLEWKNRRSVAHG